MNIDELISKIEGLGLKVTPELDKHRILIYKKDTNVNVYLQIFEDDRNYYRILLPNFYEVSSNNKKKVLGLINNANCSYRLGKVLMINKNLWISIESMFCSQDDLINRLCELIDVSVIFAKDFIKKLKK